MGLGCVCGVREVHTRSHVIFKKAKCLSHLYVHSDVSPDCEEGQTGAWIHPFLFAKHRYLTPFSFKNGSPTQGAQDNSLCVQWELKLGPGGGPLSLDTLEDLPTPLGPPPN